MTLGQMMDKPVGHLVGHHLLQEVSAVLRVEYRVEAQATPPEVGLTGTFPAQVAPYFWAGQLGVHLLTQGKRRLDTFPQGRLQPLVIEVGEPVRVESRKHGHVHGVLEWRLDTQT